MDEKNWQEPEEIEEETAQEDAAESVQEAKSAKKEKEPWQKTVLTYLHDLAVLLAALILIFLLLFRVVVVSGGSMKYTLLNGDYLLLLSNTFYHNPQAGDVVVASKQSFNDGKAIVKRVIATEGQWVDIRDGKVYVGNTKEEAENSTQPLVEDYTWANTEPKVYWDYPVLVEEGCLFVMGDNRGDSDDSRSNIGLVEKREILGKVIFLFLPGPDENGEKDFGRIGVID